ncbi:MAG: hypothetical protein OXC83_12035 [Chloroflexi bacterium]|nr:hypothetical protein [Chloroflexota bacterium]
MRNSDTAVPTRSSNRPTVPTRPTEEIARLGKEIYDRNIRTLVEADHHGEVVSIDVDSGSWAIGEDVLEAVNRLRGERHNAINILSERVGYRTLRSFGAGSVRRTV